MPPSLTFRSELPAGSETLMPIPFTRIVKEWNVWGIPVLVELLAPWQDKITGLAIISDYWQPQLNVFCSAFGALAAMFVFAFLHDQPQINRRSWAYWLMILFLASFLTTLGFHQLVGVYLFPQDIWLPVVRTIWVVSYILVFASSGGLIIALLLLGMNQELKSHKAHHKAQLKKSVILFQSELEAAKAFINLHQQLLPRNRSPDMDWDVACEDFALNFEQVENMLVSYIQKNGAVLKDETLERLKNAKYWASEGKLTFANSGVSEEGIPVVSK